MAVIEAVVTCLVVAISDGDTLKVRCGESGQYQQVIIRLAEIDAPEKKQPFGNVSKHALSDLCFQQMAKVTPETMDRFGRTVAHVECRGKDASAQQVLTGNAWVFDRYVKDRSLYTLQKAAQEQRLGLWRDPNPLAPWLWRAQQRAADATQN